jgi:hypothetical protein
MLLIDMINGNTNFANDFANMIIDNNVAMIQKVGLGFVINDCQHVKNAIGNLMADGLTILEIFTDEQKMDFIHLINSYNNG